MPRRLLGWAGPGALALLFLAHLATMLRHAVDIPYWDDWDEIGPGKLGPALTWGWLLERHNTSLVVPTKLMFWAGYRLDGFDIIHQQGAVFLVFGATLAFAAAVIRRAAPGLPLWAACAFLAFSLCPTAHQGLAWAYDSPHRFAMLFFLAAVWLLLDDRCAPARAAAGAACGLASILSNSSGVLAAPVLAAAAGRLAWTERGRPSALPRAAAAAVLLAACAAWLAGYRPNPDEPGAVGPSSWAYWAFLANLISWGFGMDQNSFALGAACASLAAWPIFRLVRLGRRPGYGLAAALGGLVAVLAGCALGRAAFGVEYAKASRYATLASLLVPFMAAAWWIALEGRQSRPRVLAGLWALLFAAHADNWDFSVYRRIREERLAGLECVRTYYESGGEAYCPMVYHHPLAARLDWAKTTQISFYRRLREHD
ncbi:MAG: hypothetical protein HY553_01705 [Elusimicrobia bacterium]|nr:hypothetical protein [Elusimicrobiota bacterium]